MTLTISGLGPVATDADPDGFPFPLTSTMSKNTLVPLASNQENCTCTGLAAVQLTVVWPPKLALDDGEGGDGLCGLREGRAGLCGGLQLLPAG